MTDIETAIMIKNMARETVRRMTATAKNAALREVAVTYSDGTTITTSMAAHLSDADIKNYFRVGREFNIGSGAKDKMVKVKSVKILNTTVKNADEKYPYLEAIKGKIAAEGYKNPTEVEIKKIFSNVVLSKSMTEFALKYKRMGLLNTTAKNADYKTTSSVSGVRGVFADEKEAQESAKRQQAASVKSGSKAVWSVKKRGNEFVVWEEKAAAKNSTPAQKAVEDFAKLVAAERPRVARIADTLDGARKLREIYEKQFHTKCRHVEDAIYDIARVNVLRAQKGESKLI